MISTNKLIDIYNAWGEKNDLHPMSDPRDMKHDARLNKKEVSWIDKFLKVFEKADKIEQSISKLFYYRENVKIENSSEYILKSNVKYVIDVRKGTDRDPRPSYRVDIDGMSFGLFVNVYDAMRELLKQHKNKIHDINRKV
tara:strand:- start:332 stop:751 length:420 start_codon:yes stop_codon:yes gene_type:complete